MTAKKTSPRVQLLETASNLVSGDRNRQYGDPNSDFRRTASFWTTYMGGVVERRLAGGESFEQILATLFQPQDVAAMMVCLKMSRISWTPGKDDSWTDAAGYIACGWDCVVADGNAL